MSAGQTAGAHGTDPRLFTHENLLEQLREAPYALGAYTLRFYAENGRPVSHVTGEIAEFYLYPSGGALRDAAFRLVLYDSRYDTYRGFVPPPRTQV